MLLHSLFYFDMIVLCVIMFDSAAYLQVFFGGDVARIPDNFAIHFFFGDLLPCADNHDKLTECDGNFGKAFGGPPANSHVVESAHFFMKKLPGVILGALPILHSGFAHTHLRQQGFFQEHVSIGNHDSRVLPLGRTEVLSISCSCVVSYLCLLHV
jgi:hypothetical protein